MIIGTLLRFEVYSSIKGYWSLCVWETENCRGLLLRKGSLLGVPFQGFLYMGSLLRGPFKGLLYKGPFFRTRVLWFRGLGV